MNCHAIIHQLTPFFHIILLVLCLPTQSLANHHLWTVADGLPTGEVKQIVALPNHQMLINCEGVFCLSNGRSFSPVACNHSRAYPMKRFAIRYHHLWQGDSLLWLRDLYKVYLFDNRSGTFRYDIAPRIRRSPTLRKFANGELNPKPVPARFQLMLDSLGLGYGINCATTDWQGGSWIGTTQDGIVYISPRPSTVRVIGEGGQWNHKTAAAWRQAAQSLTDSKGRTWDWYGHQDLICHNHGKATHYHNGNVKGLGHNSFSFVCELPDHQLLICWTLNELGYFSPERREFVSLNAKIPSLARYRHFVGACPIGKNRVVVYSQNGAFVLDTRYDTAMPFAPEAYVKPYTLKYNCMLVDRQKRLWIGTQDGLYCQTSLLPGQGRCHRVSGLANACIRSLVMDATGNIWVGTSCGISKVEARPRHSKVARDIATTVVNYGPDDGIPPVAMTDRAACLSPTGELVFVHGTSVIAFRPERMEVSHRPLSVVLTSLMANGERLPMSSDIVLRHTQNDLAFQFSALNYASPSHTRYRYRLAGLEKGWQALAGNDGRQGSVEYRNLPHGTYRFEVEASADGTHWGKAAVCAFRVRPPFWLTWWAKAAYSLLAIALTSGLLRLYLKKKKAKMERENDKRVSQLFELREEARHQFAENTNIDPKKISVNQEEGVFMAELLRCVEQNMGNADYNVDQLARDVAVGRTRLYEQLRNMLGISPTGFIRNVRLKHAAHLLSETQLPIADIATSVGFNSARLFSTHFKRMFGVLPSEYRS